MNTCTTQTRTRALHTHEHSTAQHSTCTCSPCITVPCLTPPPYPPAPQAALRGVPVCHHAGRPRHLLCLLRQPQHAHGAAELVSGAACRRYCYEWSSLLHCSAATAMRGAACCHCCAATAVLLPLRGRGFVGTRYFVAPGGSTWAMLLCGPWGLSWVMLGVCEGRCSGA